MRLLAAMVLTMTCLPVLVAGPRPDAAQEASVAAAATRAEFLRVIARPTAPLDPSPAALTVENGYSYERLSFASEPGERVPLLTVRKGQRGPQAVIIALHGTNGSKDSIRALLESYADLGFMGVAIDARHHGERARPIPGLANPYQSAILLAYRSGEGHPYLYDTVWDVMRLVDYLVTRPDVAPAKIGLIGNSKGGTEAYLAAAADERIAAVVPLIGVQSFGWSLRRPSAWEARTWTLLSATEAAAAADGATINAAFVRKFYDRIAPGLVDRFDGPAMLPLIAPRPLLVVNGDSDPRSPLGGVRAAVASAERAYAEAGAKEKFSFLLQVDAAHEVTPEAHSAARQWFVRWLSPSIP
jgi:dienelactone hydrolase